LGCAEGDDDVDDGYLYAALELELEFVDICLSPIDDRGGDSLALDRMYCSPPLSDIVSPDDGNEAYRSASPSPSVTAL